MSYRDEIAAANARADALEQELASARAELDDLRGRRDHALVVAAPTALQLRPRQRAAARWLGAPTRLVVSDSIDGETSEDLFPQLVDCIRRELGPGNVSTLKGSFTFTRRGATLMSVDVTSRNGRTTIQIEEQLNQVAGAIFGGVGGGLGVGGIAPIALLTTELLAPALIPLGIVGWLGGLYFSCRQVYRRLARRRARRLQMLLQQLAEMVRAAR